MLKKAACKLELELTGRLSMLIDSLKLSVGRP